MATNPMKRRERNAALIGFLSALLIMAIVVIFVFKMYSEKKDELEYLKSQQKTVLVAAEQIESGTNLTPEMFTYATVMTDMFEDDYYTDVDSLLGDPTILVDDEGNELNEKEYLVSSKINIPSGTIVTKGMFVPTDDVVTDDVRIQEYSCIVLPSQLEEGDFVDIRFSLPSGQDYIVISRKQVTQADANTMWIKVNEAELLQLNSAIVENWTITGSKLYAIEYVEAGMQQKSSLTYKPNAEVMDLINADPNIVSEAYNTLAKGLSEKGKHTDAKIDSYRNYIDDALTEYIEDRDSAVDSGNSDEISKIQARREQYVESLQSGSVTQ